MSDTPDSARVTSRQMPVFARSGPAVCDELGLNIEEARRLYRDGILSFDVDTSETLDEACEAELVFLGSLLAAGCNRLLLRRVLRGLHKPYCYDIRRIFFDWKAGEWRLRPGDDDPEEAFFALLERLQERREMDALLNIRSWLDDALDLARGRTAQFCHEHLAEDHSTEPVQQRAK